MKIQNVTDASFRKYGKIITEYSFEKISMIQPRQKHFLFRQEPVQNCMQQHFIMPPCTAQEGGFRCVVVLPKGTNEALPFETAKEGENRLLAAMNKWLIAHEDAQIEGAFCGLQGENVEV